MNAGSSRAATLGLLLLGAGVLSGCAGVPGCDPVPEAISQTIVGNPYTGIANPSEGYAVAYYTITASGGIENIDVVEAAAESSDPQLERAFARAVEVSLAQWRYPPRRSACRVQKTFRFELVE